MTTFDLHSAPGHLLRRLYQHHNVIFSEETFESDLTSPQFAVLAAVANGPGTTDQISLSRLVGIDRTTIGGIIDRLERRRLVKRSSDRNDGRRNIVQLTASGRRLYESLVPRVNAVGDRMLEPLAAAERRELVRLLAALVDAIDEQSAELEEIPSSRRSRAS